MLQMLATLISVAAHADFSVQNANSEEAFVFSRSAEKNGFPFDQKRPLSDPLHFWSTRIN